MILHATYTQAESYRLHPSVLPTGREASTRTLNLHQAGVQVDERTGKVEVDPRETTTAPNIFAKALFK